MRLPQRLELQRATETQDSTTHELTETWATYRKVWGKVEDKSAREQLRGDGTTAVVDTLVTIRYPKDGLGLPTTSEQILYAEDSDTTRKLNIVGVRRKKDDRRWLLLDCKEAAS